MMRPARGADREGTDHGRLHDRRHHHRRIDQGRGRGDEDRSEGLGRRPAGRRRDRPRGPPRLMPNSIVIVLVLAE
ncbi:MAG: hypothetical protein MZU79_07310 [Anaerotruncus sp.]|nr:hypothetical protein [Anaerotruncus sp.]